MVKFPAESSINDTSPRSLDVVQNWFQTVITHQGGVEEGVESSAARKYIHAGRNEIERIIGRSKALTAQERLSIYAHAYYARLVECLGESFPVLKRTLGEDLFESFAVEYLQRYPSSSYTLDRLGSKFSRFLREVKAESKTDGKDPSKTSWPDFLMDLARLEWTAAQVFDGPGGEGQTTLSADQLQTMSSKRFSRARLILAPCVRLMTFHFPVNGYYAACRRAPEEEIPIPSPQIEYVAIHRVNFVVRRYPLTLAQKTLLEELNRGVTVGEAIRTVAETARLQTSELAKHLQSWFAFWTSEQFFHSLRNSD